jgi:hypothetical protein
VVLCGQRDTQTTDSRPTNGSSDGEVMLIKFPLGLDASKKEREHMHHAITSVIIHEFVHHLQFATDPASFGKKVTKEQISNYLQGYSEIFQTLLKSMDLRYLLDPTEIEAQTFEYAYLHSKNKRKSFVKLMLEHQGTCVDRAGRQLLALMHAPVFKRQRQLSKEHHVPFPPNYITDREVLAREL